MSEKKTFGVKQNKDYKAYQSLPNAYITWHLKRFRTQLSVLVGVPKSANSACVSSQYFNQNSWLVKQPCVVSGATYCMLLSQELKTLLKSRKTLNRKGASVVHLELLNCVPNGQPPPSHLRHVHTFIVCFQAATSAPP